MIIGIEWFMVLPVSPVKPVGRLKDLNLIP